jgi:peptidoglycan/LPS O-acetylase OafA/YrhL
MPTLDGWRAIAILAVIFYHDSLHTIGALSTRPLYEHGNLGVDVFFAISGLLICSRLLDDERIYGKIHLKDFYVRRGFRILPPVFLYLGVITLLSVFSVVSVNRAELVECFLFCRNTTHFLGAPAENLGFYTNHFWSLSLEEQFYLLLPAFLVLTAKRYRAQALGLLAAAVVVHRALALGSRPWILIQFHTDVRIDALLVPALFAVMSSSPRNRAVFQKYLRLWPLGILIFLILVPFAQGTAWGQSIFIWLLPAIVLGSVLNPANVLGRFLEWSVLRYIGRISYSLYLWQQLFITDHFLRGGLHPLGFLQSWPLRLAVVFVISAISYHLLECPLTRLGHRLAPPATAGREELDVSAASPTQRVPLSDLPVEK